MSKIEPIHIQVDPNEPSVYEMVFGKKPPVNEPTSVLDKIDIAVDPNEPSVYEIVFGRKLQSESNFTMKNDEKGSLVSSIATHHKDLNLGWRERELNNAIRRSRKCGLTNRLCIRRAFREEMKESYAEHRRLSLGIVTNLFATGVLFTKAPAIYKASLALGIAIFDNPEAISHTNINDLIETFTEDPEQSIIVTVVIVAAAILAVKIPATKAKAEEVFKWVFTFFLGKTHLERMQITYDTTIPEEEKSYQLGGKIGELSIFTFFAGMSAIAETIKMNPVIGQILCLPDDTIFAIREFLQWSQPATAVAATE